MKLVYCLILAMVITGLTEAAPAYPPERTLSLDETVKQADIILAGKMASCGKGLKCIKVARVFKGKVKAGIVNIGPQENVCEDCGNYLVFLTFGKTPGTWQRVNLYLIHGDILEGKSLTLDEFAKKYGFK